MENNKSKFLLCLALVLNCVLFGCATNRPVYPLPSAAFPEPGIYLVQPGDSATRIAKNLCLTVEQLSALNPRVDWLHLKIGLKLYYAPETSDLPIRYHNAQYDFTFYLPESWKGYSVLIQQWKGGYYSSALDKEVVTEYGQEIILRHPLWKTNDLYQDIPIVVFTRKQWDEERNGKSSADISAGGTIDELWHNRKYVFAMSSRYNAADDIKDWDKASDIIATNCAAHSEPTLYPNP